MNENIVFTTKNYDHVDGYNAYKSAVKKITLGFPSDEQNIKREPVTQIWKENADGKHEICLELPIHQIFDLMIILSRTMLYFKEAYRIPLLYNPDNPIIDKIGMQGDALLLEVCTDNPAINEDIKAFSQALSDWGEITGERLRLLTYIIKELEMY